MRQDERVVERRSGRQHFLLWRLLGDQLRHGFAKALKCFVHFGFVLRRRVTALDFVFASLKLLKHFVFEQHEFACSGGSGIVDIVDG